MNLGKDGRFFAAYGDCWALMKKYSQSKCMEDIRNFVNETRDMEKKYPEYADFVGSTLYHYGKLIEKEIMENEGNMRKEV